MQVIAPDNTKEVLHKFKDKFNELKFYNDNTLSWIRHANGIGGNFYITGSFENALRNFTLTDEATHKIIEEFKVISLEEFNVMKEDAKKMWKKFHETSIRPKGIVIDVVIIE